MAKRLPERLPVETREFRSTYEIDTAISKLHRRILEIEKIDVSEAVLKNSGAADVATSNLKEAIRDIFGSNSPEFREHEHIRMWAGAMYLQMEPSAVIQATERGRTYVVGIIKGLIERLQEKRDDLVTRDAPTPRTYFDHLNLHHRISGVSRDLFLDGYHWEAVFAASKALVNFVKERSGLNDLDGAQLVRAAFSRNDPYLQFNELSNQTDMDEQEGMMHLFEGAILGIRNPGGHSFPEGTEQRAIEYLSLLNLLAYRLQEAKKKKYP